MDAYRIVAENPLLGILRNVPTEQVIPYIEAAMRGGVRFFEVALNSKDALKQISMLREHFGDSCLIGGGTAITVPLCENAIAAGAQFLLTPGTPPDVFRYCADHDVILIPGVLSPTDVAVSFEYGYKTMKLFPAGSMPMRYVKDLKGPFDNAEFMAIGGVSPDNIADFLNAGCLGAGLGSALMPKEAAARGDWDTCTEYVRDLVSRIPEERRKFAERIRASQ
ncbi:MAG: bifunctional 4-hydroxy-2-oxoglutarate aldolase/2-dehydro-3-deoxy-phosphogluconate aldolase [Firmicutes bacterium]|nr:bifunctional 4-hydroxy-2-oxoglutarate aldolase/2-dehydro-3-deoxy-phosphogluconate aldolase [Bacillota bacterium]